MLYKTNEPVSMKEKAAAAILCGILLCVNFYLCNALEGLPAYVKAEAEPVLQSETVQRYASGTEILPEEQRLPVRGAGDTGFLPLNDASQFDLKLYSLSACLIDAESRRILYSRNFGDQMPMASTTKILTCLLALEHCSPEETVTVSEYAASMPDVQLNMVTGDSFYLKDLLYSLMLESHNDTAVAIAEHVSGSVPEFAALMNRRATELGLHHSYFITPNGLDRKETLSDGTIREHSTTAYELAVILSECIKNRDFVEICQTQSKAISNTQGTRQYQLSNHNSLLRTMEGVIAGKTGFTCNAGYCYVGAVKRNGATLVAALLACGWPNNKNYKWYDMNVLVDFAEEKYEWTDYRENTAEEDRLQPLPVINGIREGRIVETVSLKRTPDSSYPQEVFMRPEEQLTIVYQMPEELVSPIRQGETVGSVTYYIGNDIIGKDLISVQETVAEITRLDYLLLTLRRFLLQSDSVANTRLQ